jgi:DNA polymerase-3 subunit epsilon
MINRVLIVDTETTGLAPHSSQVIEIGAILYSVRHQTTLQQMSILLPAKDNPRKKLTALTFIVAGPAGGRAGDSASLP